jgi:hypothetical protein
LGVIHKYIFNLSPREMIKHIFDKKKKKHKFKTYFRITFKSF